MRALGFMATGYCGLSYFWKLLTAIRLLSMTRPGANMPVVNVSRKVMCWCFCIGAIWAETML